ncbi:MAG: hypothetical protein RLP02_10155, partial [Coleofasciculus sp. C2-GNP5-27]
YVKEMVSDPGRCLIRISDKELSANVRTKVRAHKAEISQLFEEVFEAGVNDRTITDGDAKLTAFLVAGALNYVGTWYEPGQSYDVEQITARMLGILMYGLVPRDTNKI